MNAFRLAIDENESLRPSVLTLVHINLSECMPDVVHVSWCFRIVMVS